MIKIQTNKFVKEITETLKNEKIIIFPNKNKMKQQKIVGKLHLSMNI